VAVIKLFASLKLELLLLVNTFLIFFLFLGIFLIHQTFNIKTSIKKFSATRILKIIIFLLWLLKPLYIYKALRKKHFSLQENLYTNILTLYQVLRVS